MRSLDALTMLTPAYGAVTGARSVSHGPRLKLAERITPDAAIGD